MSVGLDYRTMHGATEHHNVTRELFLPANEGRIVVGTPYSYGKYATVEGTANANQPTVELTMKVPDDFVSFTSLQAVWATAAAGGNMYWWLVAFYAASGEAYNIHNDQPALGATANGGANIMNVQAPANPLTLANLAKGDYIGVEFLRQGTDVLDTLDTDMYLFGLLFTYVAEQ